jgi:hypothetical protein
MADVLQLWQKAAKTSKDLSNSSDVLITVENLEKYLGYQGLARVNRTKKTNPLNTSEDECSKEVPLDTCVEGEASDYSLGYTWPSDTNPSFAGLETLGDCKVTLRRGEASDATSYGPKLNITIKTQWNWWWLVAVTKVEPLTTISRPTWTNLASSSFLSSSFFFFFFFFLEQT